MDPVTQHLISSYLLMPVLTVIFGIAAYFIARKNKLLNNKKLIVYLLLCGIVLALPALSGFMDYSFMPYIYVLLAILYWTAGYYNRFLLRKVFASGKETPSFGIRCLLTVTVVLLLILNSTCTAYYPSYTDLQSSLTLANSCSSEFTLKTMAYVSILVPFVIAYIFYAWRSIDRHKITEKEMDEGGHSY